MSDRYRVTVLEQGRSGRIRYSEGILHSHEFYWEFGGGDAVALISVPTPEEWPAAVPWAATRRSEILERVGAEVCRQRCPTCRPVHSDGWIELVAPPAAQQ